MKIVFATGNKGKLREASEILGEGFELISLPDVGINEDVPETGDTLLANSLQKAMYVYEKCGCDCFADDTGLEVEALNNAPGIYSARYAGPGHDSEANMNKLLQEMKDKENRKAQFRTAIALILNGKEYLFEGIVRGSIITEKRGNSGFGYDPIFVPENYTETFAELGNDIKNQISHRAEAVKKLIEFLSNYTH